jgi:hypothetical protein
LFTIILLPFEVSSEVKHQSQLSTATPQTTGSKILKSKMYTISKFVATQFGVWFTVAVAAGSLHSLYRGIVAFVGTVWYKMLPPTFIDVLNVC